MADTFQAQGASHTHKGPSKMYAARHLVDDIHALLCRETWLLVRL